MLNVHKIGTTNLGEFQVVFTVMLHFQYIIKTKGTDLKFMKSDLLWLKQRSIKTRTQEKCLLVQLMLRLVTLLFYSDDIFEKLKTSLEY